MHNDAYHASKLSSPPKKLKNRPTYFRRSRELPLEGDPSRKSPLEVNIEGELVVSFYGLN